MGWTDYDTHARTRSRDDLWGQVRRTVHGKPVPPEQIDLIVATIMEQLALTPEDMLLDLACGNGALTARLHPHCGASLGVDISPYLAGVAEDRFATVHHRFIVADAADYARSEPNPDSFTKALCYGSLAYLGDASVSSLLRSLHERFVNVRRLAIGNLPDPARAAAFYGARDVPSLREPHSDIGVWRSAAELAELAGSGWRVSVSTMPAGFFAAHYRFDAVLERRT